MLQPVDAGGLSAGRDDEWVSKCANSSSDLLSAMTCAPQWLNIDQSAPAKASRAAPDSDCTRHKLFALQAAARYVSTMSWAKRKGFRGIRKPSCPRTQIIRQHWLQLLKL